MSENIYLFTHIPKTAGTSIRKHFQEYLKDQIEFIHLTNSGNLQAQKIGLKPYLLRSEKDKSAAKVILGHQVNSTTKDLFKNKNIIEVVFFREPIAWEVSRYNQFANKIKKTKNITLSMDFWLNQSNKLHSQFDWFLANYLGLKNQIKKFKHDDKIKLLEQTLETFDSVLFIEDLPDCIKSLFNQIGVPEKMGQTYNVVGIDKPNSYETSKINSQRLQELCAKDVEIYTQLYKNYGLND
jgi:hypothetical protein